MDTDQLSIRNGVSDKQIISILEIVVLILCHPYRHLHTMDTARRRGFGKLLVMMWCKQFIALENADPIAEIIAENNASRKLFGSLGFEVFRESWHIKLDTFKN